MVVASKELAARWVVAKKAAATMVAAARAVGTGAEGLLVVEPVVGAARGMELQEAAREEEIRADVTAKAEAAVLEARAAMLVADLEEARADTTHPQRSRCTRQKCG